MRLTSSVPSRPDAQLTLSENQPEAFASSSATPETSQITRSKRLSFHGSYSEPARTSAGGLWRFKLAAALAVAFSHMSDAENWPPRPLFPNTVVTTPEPHPRSNTEAYDLSVFKR